MLFRVKCELIVLLLLVMIIVGIYCCCGYISRPYALGRIGMDIGFGYGLIIEKLLSIGI